MKDPKSSEPDGVIPALLVGTGSDGESFGTIPPAVPPLRRHPTFAKISGQGHVGPEPVKPVEPRILHYEDPPGSGRWIDKAEY